MEMHEVKTWQDTAWQESFQLTGSGQWWKISPGAFHTQEEVGKIGFLDQLLIIWANLS